MAADAVIFLCNFRLAEGGKVVIVYSGDSLDNA